MLKVNLTLEILFNSSSVSEVETGTTLAYCPRFMQQLRKNI